VLAPVRENDRISSVDVVRGAALLGIGLMNIIYSGLPVSAVFNPKVAGGATGLNLAAYFIESILVDNKMRGLFSMMFGASACLLIERLEQRGAEIFTRRVLWLMLFGIVHAYLIWGGDILYNYALLGLVLPPLVRVRPRNLLIGAGVVWLFLTGQSVVHGLQLRRTHALAETGDKAAKAEWQETLSIFNPSSADIQQDKDMFGGSYFHLVGKRAEQVKELHSTPFYLNSLDSFAMMLVGIAFIKSGVLSARRSVGFYWRMLAVSYAIGLPISIFAAWTSWRDGFGPELNIFVFSTEYIGVAGVMFGHLAALVLICKYDLVSPLRERVAAVGRMAFSNYIAHSLIYGFVFYGYGFNLYDKLQRYQLYCALLGMWAFSLIWSPLWLWRFRFGPLEWGWRSLTYWSRIDVRVSPARSSSDQMNSQPSAL
jgi:uncharacterized protein